MLRLRFRQGGWVCFLSLKLGAVGGVGLQPSGSLISLDSFWACLFRVH